MDKNLGESVKPLTPYGLCKQIDKYGVHAYDDKGKNPSVDLFDINNPVAE